METVANTAYARLPIDGGEERTVYSSLWEGAAAHQVVGRVMPTKPTTGRGPERVTPHTGTETRPRLLREAAVRNIAQWTQV